MAALPGPAGGLLLREGGNPDGDIGKLYFPAEKTFIHIEPELLGDQDLYDFLCWSQGANRIIASDGRTCMPCLSKPSWPCRAMMREPARKGRRDSSSCHQNQELGPSP